MIGDSGESSFTGTAIAVVLAASLCGTFTVGCGPRSASVAPKREHASARPALTASPALVTSLREHCGDCHDGTGGRPRIDGTIVANKPLALRAALYVASREMPPPPSTAPLSPEMQALVAELCRIGAYRPEACLTANLPRKSGAPVFESGAYLRALDRVAPRGAEKPSEAEVMLREHDHPSDGRIARIARLDPTAAVLRLMIANERCEHPLPPLDTRQCIEAVLDDKLTSFPVPVVDAQRGDK